MLRRLFIGLVLGLIIGGLAAAVFVAGLKVLVFEGAGGLALAYLAVSIVGAVTGLIAGKPIWASDAKVEAGLKAVFGALLGAGAMFALRQWASSWTADLSFLGAGGPAAIGALPAASLPLIAATLGALFELDNTEEKKTDPKPSERKRVAPQRSDGAARSAGAAGGSDEGAASGDFEADAGSKHAKR